MSLDAATLRYVRMVARDLGPGATHYQFDIDTGVDLKFERAGEDSVVLYLLEPSTRDANGMWVRKITQYEIPLYGPKEWSPRKEAW